MNKIESLMLDYQIQKREKTQITKIRNKTRDITIDFKNFLKYKKIL